GVGKGKARDSLLEGVVQPVAARRKGDLDADGAKEFEVPVEAADVEFELPGEPIARARSAAQELQEAEQPREAFRGDGRSSSGFRREGLTFPGRSFLGHYRPRCPTGRAQAGPTPSWDGGRGAFILGGIVGVQPDDCNHLPLPWRPRRRRLSRKRTLAPKRVAPSDPRRLRMVERQPTEASRERQRPEGEAPQDVAPSGRWRWRSLRRRMLPSPPTGRSAGSGSPSPGRGPPGLPSVA